MKRLTAPLSGLLLLIGLICMSMASAAEEGPSKEQENADPAESASGNPEPPVTEGKKAEEELDRKRFKPSDRTFAFEPVETPVVLHIRIDGTIDLGLSPFVSRVLKEAENRPEVVAVISEINTPGGRVDAAVEIKSALLESGIPTIAWVHSQAISAGALIAYGHNGIFFASGGTMGAATPIQMAPGGNAEPVGEKVVSYMRGVMRATAEARDRDGELAESMVDASLIIPGISAEGKLVTLTDREARNWGVSDGEANSLKSLLATLGLEGAAVETPEPNWGERIARVLTDPAVSGILMVVGMLGLWIELSSPGFGLPGILGALSFLLFFGGHAVVQLVGAEELALFVVGLSLLFVEIFVLPGFGLAGIAGICAIVGALAMMMVGLPLEVSWELGTLGDAVSRVSLSLGFTMGLAILAFRYLPQSRAAHRLVLGTSMDGEKGFESFDTAKRTAWLGRTGEVMSDLRPSGKARFDDQWVDVISQGRYIPKGERVTVIQVEGARIVVQVLPNPPSENEENG